MVVDGAVVMMENIIRHFVAYARPGAPTIRPCDCRCDPRTLATRCSGGVLCHCHHHTAYMPIFTLQRIEGRLFRPMAWTVLCIAGCDDVFHFYRSGAKPAYSFAGIQGGGATGSWSFWRPISEAGSLGDRSSLDHCRVGVMPSPERSTWDSAGVIGSEFCRIWMKARSGRAAPAHSTSLPEGEKICRRERFVLRVIS